jgi:hypothetical protein
MPQLAASARCDLHQQQPDRRVSPSGTVAAHHSGKHKSFSQAGRDVLLDDETKLQAKVLRLTGARGHCHEGNKICAR